MWTLHKYEYWGFFIGNLSLNLNFSDYEALQQAHLLRSMGHSRQASDSSIDKFVSKDEAAEPGDQENKVRCLGRRPLGILSFCECLGSLWLLSVCLTSIFPISELLPTYFPLSSDHFLGVLLFSASMDTTQILENWLKFCLLRVLPRQICLTLIATSLDFLGRSFDGRALSCSMSCFCLWNNTFVCLRKIHIKFASDRCKERSLVA